MLSYFHGGYSILPTSSISLKPSVLGYLGCAASKELAMLSWSWATLEQQSYLQELLTEAAAGALCRILDESSVLGTGPGNTAATRLQLSSILYMSDCCCRNCKNWDIHIWTCHMTYPDWWSTRIPESDLIEPSSTYFRRWIVPSVNSGISKQYIGMGRDFWNTDHPMSVPWQAGKHQVDLKLGHELGAFCWLKLAAQYLRNTVQKG